ncbi:pullulanase-type alpha-1,6-glucosidase [Catenulispora yoronensis]|uniref:1,4-alpha-D-glucan glucanohydrolase n=1 Tax=Catenulispora yoronensis TaxID=450799 RepID=A0ABP5F6W9_9ACTN
MAAPSDASLTTALADRPGLTREQYYFVLPDRFANGDTDNDTGGLTGGLTGDRMLTGFDPTDKGFYHGGDLKGLASKLDYIKGLGTTAIWMAPIFKNKPVQGTGANASAGYHGYWVTDFTQVDPHFGTNQDLKDLIKAAHAKGMKVFFDVITNHTADVIDYKEGQYDYRSKAAYPYLDASGRPFDDSDYADGSKPFPKVTTASFPYQPVFDTPSDATAKTPAWLNDPTLYHNRGNSTFAGESGDEGDFSGLDDLWTERPEVVKGMEQIYESWVDFGVDGYRIDTVKNVDLPFWTQWSTALKSYAAKHGKPNFFMFGEVYDADPTVQAPYVTQGKLDATLGFPFQDAARAFASQGASSQRLSALYAKDSLYTSATSNAYEQPTFLGNHDMGRIGSFLKQDNPNASQSELLQRDILANQLMFLTRGQPVVYYGDEQGFIGAGGDKDARQDMFPSRTPDYLADPQIGTTRTDATAEYDPTHPLYQAIATLSQLRKTNPALADGVQVERYAADGPGVYAFSRIDQTQQIEYVVAVNNATTAQTVRIPTYSASATFGQLYPSGTASLTTATDATLTVTVPPLTSVVYKAGARLAAPTTPPSLTLTTPAAGVTGTATIGATVPTPTSGTTATPTSTSTLNRVTFAAAIGTGPWQILGTADHAPYQVTQDLSKTAPGAVVRYKAVVTDSAGKTASATGSTTVGTVPPAPPRSTVQYTYAVVHYTRPDGNYDGWNLYTWGDIDPSMQTTWPAGQPFVGRDAYGAFAYVKLKPGASSVGFIIENNGTKDVDSDRSIDLTKSGEVWVKQGDATVSTTSPITYPPVPPDTAVIHYHRADGAYAGWGLHDWTGAANPTSWSAPLAPSGTDAFGDVFTVPLAPGASSLSYILHNGDTKDLPDDQSLTFADHGREIWILGGQPGYLLPLPAATTLDADLTKAQAQWIDATTVAWKKPLSASLHYQLVYAPSGGITIANGDLSDPGYWIRLNQVPGGLTAAQLAKYPNLAGYSAFTVDPRDAARVKPALRSQLLATERDGSGNLLAATGVQIPGVLDALYSAASSAALGPVFDHNKPTLSVWAPTAQSVKLELFDDAKATTKPTVVPMDADDRTGVWSVRGKPDWNGKYYLYQVTVWAPSVQKLVVNEVTDPYSLSLSADSTRSQIVDLSDSKLAPDAWKKTPAPQPIPAAKQEITELHVRDFSAADTSVPAADRGTYLAFTDSTSLGLQHLKALAQSGVTTVHLLPVFDFSSVPEPKSEQSTPPCDLPSFPSDSDQQQACVTKTAATDAYNWGYDPYHFTVPEGSYSTDPNGTPRIVQFRQMVAALHAAGLRVVLDVVYNHTAAAGQDPHSVLDRIVPGYYQRLSDAGAVTTDSCCADTAPEHAMMDKLVVDSVTTWARQYHVDGFRFDLMGLDPKQTMLDVQSALGNLTLARDGVDGKALYLYGEGWNFGTVADNARFVNASQTNMAGTGIGTFNDRLRDAVRGGGPFDADPRIQGFASGLYTDPNGDAVNGATADQKARLLHDQDLIKVGLTGALASYAFTDSTGKPVTGAQVDYNGSPAGYAANPADAITYVDAHDNEILFDALAYKLPASTSTADRARMQVLALATTVLSQGPGFSAAGSDLLRSKSFDGNSYDSGDWFNAIHWDCATGTGFGQGLPPAAANQSKWPYMRPLLADAALKPDCATVTATSAAYQDLLRIKQSSPLFALGTAQAVQAALSFPLSGSTETPGVITMRLGTGAKSLTVVFNATPSPQTQAVPALAGTTQVLDPIQAAGSDAVVKTSAFDTGTGTFTVPARSVAVFVQG